MANDLDIRAAEHVLGLRPAADRDRVMREADADPAFAERIVDWDARLAPLLGDDEAAPPAGLFDRVLAAIDRRTQHLADTFTVRTEDGIWVPIAEGVERKTLWAKGPNGRQTFLLRMAPGAHYTAHTHGDDEECYVLAGDLTFDTLTLVAGDYHLARRSAAHPSATTRSGCMVLITALP